MNVQFQYNLGTKVYDKSEIVSIVSCIYQNGEISYRLSNGRFYHEDRIHSKLYYPTFHGVTVDFQYEIGTPVYLPKMYGVESGIIAYETTCINAAIYKDDEKWYKTISRVIMTEDQVETDLDEHVKDKELIFSANGLYSMIQEGRLIVRTESRLPFTSCVENLSYGRRFLKDVMEFLENEAMPGYKKPGISKLWYRIKQHCNYMPMPEVRKFVYSHPDIFLCEDDGLGL